MITAKQTDIGRIRTVNEDRAVVRTDMDGFVFAIVADGMGGHQAGDIASQMATEFILEHLEGIHKGMSIEECQDTLKDAVQSANEKVFEFSFQKEVYHGMGTTIVAVLSTAEWIIVAHIGDSRAYKLSGGTLNQLTEDHSLVNELVKSGQITVEEAGIHPRKNVLIRALGTEQQVEVEITHYTWQPREVVLLCSDGLSNLVTQQTMLNVLQKEENLDWKAQHLIDEALAAGGEDNVTVVLLLNEQSDSDAMKRGDGQ